MSDFSVSPIGTMIRGGAPAAVPMKPAASDFSEALRQAVDRVDRLQRDADAAAQSFAVAENRDVAGTLIAVEKANIAFQLTLQIRNKLLEAYQEIMRMPI